MSFLFGSTPDYAGAAQDQERRRQANIAQGTADINQAFSQFSPGFYNQRAQSYYNYAMPQVAQQYQQARNAMTYGLANRGLLGGSAAQTARSQLAQSNAQAQRAVADTGIAQSQALQQQIENARNTLLGQVYQGADPGSVGLQGVNTAASFAMPSVYQPVANMFSNLASQYAQNQALAGYGMGSPVYAMPSQQSQQGYYAPTPVTY